MRFFKKNICLKNKLLQSYNKFLEVTSLKFEILLKIIMYNSNYAS